MILLNVNNITKRFGTDEVLRKVSFSLKEGETLAVIGSSGSGKTTLLRCLNFLERPDAGCISIRDEVIYDARQSQTYSDGYIQQNRLHFGLVFQSFHLFPQYTALKNVVLARELLAKTQPDYNANKKRILHEIQEEGMGILEQVGLSAKRDFYPHQLSGGQQQRVAIARALALKPDILCFDEPTSALDPELTGEVLKIIRELAQKNTTMIIVTHEMRFAYQVADQILFMDEGLVVEHGSPQEVFDNPSSERTKRFLERYFSDE